MGKAGWAIALATAALGARAQDAPLADRCIALLHGRLDPAERADAMPGCEDLVRAGAEFRSVVPEPATAHAAAAPGQPVRAALGVPAAPSRGGVRNTIVTNPLGWFSGLGVNAEYSRPVEGLDRLSWVADARYARANATNGQVTSVGVGGGLDLFLVGGNNAGLRVGPRLELAFGSETMEGAASSFARLGLSGEVGYDLVAPSGLAAQVAAGLGARLAGPARNESFDSFTGGELGPYLKLGIGFSW